MVATRGSIPKRTEMRRRTNAPADGMEVTRAASLPAEPLAPDENWHDVPLEIFTSMAESGQSVFFQASDWAMLYMICDQMNQLYCEQYLGMRDAGRGEQEPVYGRKPMNGAELSAMIKALGELGATEGARRRLRIELTQDMGARELPAGVTSMNDARARYRKGATA